MPAWASKLLHHSEVCRGEQGLGRPGGSLSTPFLYLPPSSPCRHMLQQLESARSSQDPSLAARAEQLERDVETTLREGVSRRAPEPLPHRPHTYLCPPACRLPDGPARRTAAHAFCLLHCSSGSGAPHKAAAVCTEQAAGMRAHRRMQRPLCAPSPAAPPAPQHRLPTLPPRPARSKPSASSTPSTSRPTCRSCLLPRWTTGAATCRQRTFITGRLWR